MTEEAKQRKDRSFNLYLCVGLYAASCLLVYFGVIGAILDYPESHVWKLRPEPHFFGHLGSAALTIVAPACVAVFLMYALIPLMAGLAFLAEFVRRRRNKHGPNQSLQPTAGRSDD